MKCPQCCSQVAQHTRRCLIEMNTSFTWKRTFLTDFQRSQDPLEIVPVMATERNMMR